MTLRVWTSEGRGDRLVQTECCYNHAQKRPGGMAVKGQSALGSMCDAEKDWHERSFRASGAINGCQKSPLNKPEITFSLFICKPPVTSF